MLPEPLHPVIVHFPIVMMVLLPVSAMVAWLAIRRGVPARTAWVPVVGIAAALTFSAWLAVETGQREEDTVERVVPRAAIHEHEEAAEFFFPLTIAALLIVAAGLLDGRRGEVLRGAAIVATLGVGIAGARVGHSGGELVYVHGAGAAYTNTDAGTAAIGGDDDDERRP